MFGRGVSFLFRLGHQNMVACFHFKSLNHDCWGIYFSNFLETLEQVKNLSFILPPRKDHSQVTVHEFLSSLNQQALMCFQHHHTWFLVSKDTKKDPLWPQEAEDSRRETEPNVLNLIMFPGLPWRIFGASWSERTQRTSQIGNFLEAGKREKRGYLGQEGSGD